jgi:hypothetical protein
MSSALLEATVIHAFRNVNVPPALISWKSIQVYGLYIYIEFAVYITPVRVTCLYG